MARKQPITTADLAEIAALTDLHIGSIHHLLHRLETGGLDFAPDINAVTEIANLGSALTQLATQCLFRVRIQADQERLRSELENGCGLPPNPTPARHSASRAPVDGAGALHRPEALAPRRPLPSAGTGITPPRSPAPRTAGLPRTSHAPRPRGFGRR